MDRNSSGFTLVEALVVIALMAVLFIAIPPMFRWLGQQGVGHAVDTLQADLQLARCMAVSRKQPCAVQFNHPSKDQYLITQSHKCKDLASFRGGVHFMPKGPEGRAMAEQIQFNRQGMSASIVPADIFISDENEHQLYRIRVLLPGGISVCRWNGDAWR